MSPSRRPPQGSSNIGRRRASARGDGRAEYVERRRAIVRAASEVFKDRGYTGTTLKHVADFMGVDRASLYYYVSGKQELFQEIVAEAAGVNLRAAEELRREDAPAPAKLRRLIEDLMRSYGDYYPVLYVLVQENLNHVAPEHGAWAERMKRTNRRYEQAVVEMIQAGQEEGTLRSTAPPWLLAYGIIGMVGWTNRWFDPRHSSVTAQEVGATFADMVLDGLARPARGA